MTPHAHALFLSDCHLGAGSPAEQAAREARVQAFLEREAPAASTVYLLGDVFDFWFEYRAAVFRRHFRVLAALRALAAAGVRVVFLGGNHDYWAGSFLRDEVGSEIHTQPFTERAQGRHLYLAHGDGLGPGDRAYPALRAVLRSPWTIAAFRWIHPDWGLAVADTVSRFSRGRRDESKFDAERLCDYLAEPRFADGADAVVIGHYHHPTHLKRPSGEFLILGDWLGWNTYARLEGGAFSLWQWTAEGGRRFELARATGVEGARKVS